VRRKSGKGRGVVYNWVCRVLFTGLNWCRDILLFLYQESPKLEVCERNVDLCTGYVGFRLDVDIVADTIIIGKSLFVMFENTPSLK
jgi:hypothetical protein